MSSIEPAYIQGLANVWNEFLGRDEGERIKRTLCIDGKTMRGNGGAGQEALHVVSAWSREDGAGFGQRSAKGKGHEIRLIKELLGAVRVEGHVVTIDAIGTQTEIAGKIVEKKGDYVLAVKENQGTLHEDIRLYFADGRLRDKAGYHGTVDKARGRVETREYWQTGDIGWLKADGKWKGLPGIGMTRNTIDDGAGAKSEERYFISSLPARTGDDTGLFARSVRGHWAVESMHWHLDVTFREDRNQTREGTSAENLNIMRKWSLSILKLLDLGRKHSLKKKRFALGCNFGRHVDKIMAL
jgi:predicted transposase YbfD/YdcC